MPVKSILFFLSFYLIAFSFTLNAQQAGISFNAGANMTFIPAFENRVVITNEGLTIPELVQRNNSNASPYVGTPTSETHTRPGFFANLEMWKLFREKYRLSFGFGLNQFRYSYDTYVDFDNAPPAYLSEIDHNYGKTNLLYLELNPIKFSVRTFKKKMIFGLGPTINVLIHNKINNIIILNKNYQRLDGASIEVIEKIYFDSADNLNNTLFGCCADA
ncbi:MAG: hypothetical protein KDC05_16340, partial [Bacteroidales bacterium]|nr:hypothetical protein [Bacteroidales bacterium]